VEPRRWRDTMSAQATGIWRVNDWFEIGVTGGYQSSAVPDATMSLSSPDGDRLIGALAGRVVAGRFELTAALQVQHILSRTVTTSDFDKANGTYDITLVLFSGSMAVHF